MNDQLLALINKLGDLGVERASFHPDGKLASVEFSQAASIDRVMASQTRQLSEDERLSPEDRAKIRRAAKERLIYGRDLSEDDA